MLLWLSEYFQNYFHAFHVFHYLTIRFVFASLTAFLLSLILGPSMIRYLSMYRIGQTIRTDGPQSHLQKAGTPTMGGALILVAICISTLLWADLKNQYVWWVVLVTIGFGLLGWADDYLKLTKKNSKGLSARMRLFVEIFFAGVVAFLLYYQLPISHGTDLVVPFIKNVTIELGVFFPFFVIFVIVGTSNAVNLTDGLDGLAIMPTVLVGGGLGLFAYLSGHSIFAQYLMIPFIPGTGELAIYCSALFGAGLGFLWFNTYPAQVFMGDVGALGLGAGLGTIAVMLKQELVLMIMGGLFVAETFSVILQVASFKLTGKRIFKMAPLHHHFELKGWPEPRIIVRFWIVSVLLVLLGLATLKLR